MRRNARLVSSHGLVDLGLPEFSWTHEFRTALRRSGFHCLGSLTQKLKLCTIFAKTSRRRCQGPRKGHAEGLFHAGTLSIADPFLDGVWCVSFADPQFVSAIKWNQQKGASYASGYSGDIGSGSTTAYDALPPKPWKAAP